MLQPVLVILNVPDGTDRTELGTSLESYLRRDWTVKWAVPLQYALEVPEGAISVG